MRLVGDMTRTRGNGEDDPEVWDNFPIVMPSLPPSGLPNCTIIDLSYAIQVTVRYGLELIWSNCNNF